MLQKALLFDVVILVLTINLIVFKRQIIKTTLKHIEYYYFYILQKKFRQYGERRTCRVPLLSDTNEMKSLNFIDTIIILSADKVLVIEGHLIFKALVIRK